MLCQKGEKMVKKKPVTKKKTGYSKKELEKIRKGLVETKARLLEEYMSIKGQTLNKSSKDSSGDLSSYTFHMADMASDLYDREFLLGMAEGERERVLALDEALKRIDEGIYGVCEECGCKITKQRLKVMPQAKNCIKCQEEIEKSEGR